MLNVGILSFHVFTMIGPCSQHMWALFLLFAVLLHIQAPSTQFKRKTPLQDLQHELEPDKFSLQYTQRKKSRRMAKQAYDSTETNEDPMHSTQEDRNTQAGQTFNFFKDCFKDKQGMYKKRKERL